MDYYWYTHPQCWVATVLAMIVFVLFIILLYQNEKNITARAERIFSKQDEWGKETCQALVEGEVTIGMTKEMIHQAFGPPTKIDYQRQRWEYFRKGDQYTSAVTFTLVFEDNKLAVDPVKRTHTPFGLGKPRPTTNLSVLIDAAYPK